jgi:hypothetical protein
MRQGIDAGLATQTTLPEDWDTGRCLMKAIVVTDQAAGTAGMTLMERPEPPAAINDVVV